MLDQATTMDTVNSIVFALSSADFKWPVVSVYYPKLQLALINSLTRFHLPEPREHIQNRATGALAPIKDPVFPQFTFVSDVTKLSSGTVSCSSSLLASLRDNGFGSFESVSAASVSLSSLFENVKIQDVDQISTSLASGVRLLVNLTDVKVYSQHSSRTNTASLAQEKIKSMGSSSLYQDSSRGTQPTFMKRQRRDSATAVKTLGEVNINKRAKAATQEAPPSKNKKGDKKKKEIDSFTSLYSPLPMSESNGATPHLVYSLGSLGCPWDELPSSVADAISSSLISALQHPVSEQTLVNTLHGLSSMAVSWNDLSPDLQVLSSRGLIIYSIFLI